jgi:hypothetical protein
MRCEFWKKEGLYLERWRIVLRQLLCEWLECCQWMSLSWDFLGSLQRLLVWWRPKLLLTSRLGREALLTTWLFLFLEAFFSVFLLCCGSPSVFGSIMRCFCGGHPLTKWLSGFSNSLVVYIQKVGGTLIREVQGRQKRVIVHCCMKYV